ncbi:MAG: hypothetical protein PHT33_01885 [bacterium]|nr:hypothetical protein [bacterium]
METAVIEKTESSVCEGYRMIAREISATLRDNGPLWSLQKEWCSQAFQQAHAVRAMLAVHRMEPDEAFLQGARAWAEMTLMMQGTHGHPDSYNMGYGYRLRNGVPDKWYVADCGTIAVVLLDLASLLEPGDELRDRIISSVRRFADYIIAEWSLPDGSFTLGYDDFTCLDSKPYHCANAQSNLFLWPLADITGDDRYRRQAIKATRFLANWEDYDCRYYGSGVHNRSYNGESMMVSLHYLDASEEDLRQKIRHNISSNMAQWAVNNFGTEWFRQDAEIAAKAPLLLMALYLFQSRFQENTGLAEVIKQAYGILERKVQESYEAVKKLGISGAAISACNSPVELREKFFMPKYYTTEGILGMALAVYRNKESLFPLCE